MKIREFTDRHGVEYVSQPAPQTGRDKFQNCSECFGCVQIGRVSAPIILAALYHDAIYIAGSKNNEEMSSLLLHNDAQRCNSPRGTVKLDDVAQARGLIECTTLQYHLSSHNYYDTNMDLATLLDADLQNFSLPYSMFENKQFDILRENFIENDIESRRKSSKFLKQFLSCREHIYHTPYARKHWEQQARDNIIFYNERCGK